MLLEEYVREDGVRYAAWKRNEADLQSLKQVVDSIGSHEVDIVSEKAQLAFYLNAYNAWILHHMLKAYPAKGPLAASIMFFHKKNIVVAGEKMSFDHLEQKIIRPRFNEPRIHFALNCASLSCPPLYSRAFRDSSLDELLDKLTKDFFNANDQALKIDHQKKVVYLTKLLDWYKKDFPDGVVQFINQYRSQTLPAAYKIKFLKYDWSLNASGDD
ncbi:MAG: DUF547 domain-containing protein [Verrucomicrobiota bacterium]